MAVWQNNGVLRKPRGGIQYTHARQPQPTQAPKTGPNTTLRPHDRELDTRGARSRTGGGRARKRRGGRAVRGPITDVREITPSQMCGEPHGRVHVHVTGLSPIKRHDGGRIPASRFLRRLPPADACNFAHRSHRQHRRHRARRPQPPRARVGPRLGRVDHLVEHLALDRVERRDERRQGRSRVRLGELRVLLGLCAGGRVARRGLLRLLVAARHERSADHQQAADSGAERHLFSQQRDAEQAGEERLQRGEGLRLCGGDGAHGLELERRREEAADEDAAAHQRPLRRPHVPDPAECRRRGAAGSDVCGEEAGGEGAHPAHARQVERLGGVGAQVDGGADAVDGVHPSRRHKSHGTRQAAASSFASAASRVVDGRREGRGAKGEQAGAPGAPPEATHAEQERDERAKHVVRRRKDLGHRGGDAASAPDGEEGARHRVGAQLQRREAGARRRRRQRGGATIGQAAPRLRPGKLCELAVGLACMRAVGACTARRERVAVAKRQRNEYRTKVMKSVPSGSAPGTAATARSNTL
mmetsp:Transcript_32726/g.107010  ORF Transcript_32726/g.107010 Transcript_32726/m.107010 type:complete len:529 (-) Transcript_32726:390-1976(-)